MTNPKSKRGPRKNAVGGKRAIVKPILVGKGFLGDLLKNAQAISAATGIKPSDLLKNSKFGKSQAGSVGSLGLSALGLGKKKRKPRKKQAGAGFFSDLGNGFLSGITLGAYRPKGTENIGFLPFGDEGFATKAGVKPSMIAGLAGQPEIGVGLAALGQGRKKGGNRSPYRGVSATSGREQIGVVRF